MLAFYGAALSLSTGGKGVSLFRTKAERHVKHADLTPRPGWRVLALYLLNMPLHGLVSKYVMPNYAIHLGGLADKDPLAWLPSAKPSPSKCGFESFAHAQSLPSVCHGIASYD